LGLVSAQRSAVSAPRLALGAPAPNPTHGEMSVAFRVPSAQKVTLSVHDVSGREVRTLVDGRVAAGEHVQQWDGRSNRGLAAPAGVYFVRMRTPAGSTTQRVTLLR
jgi:flagellar hook assembly protein FlgD